MLGIYLIITIDQKVLSLLAKYSDKEFYERQVARKLGIGYGSANRSLNELYSAGAIRRRQEGKMFFYSMDISKPAVIQFKKLINIALIEPLVEKLKSISNRIILYGSCAQGTDNSRSDLDLFVVSSRVKQVTKAIDMFNFPRGFEDIHIQAVIKNPAGLLKAGESETAFLAEVEQGVVLWEGAADEPRI